MPAARPSSSKSKASNPHVSELLRVLVSVLIGATHSPPQKPPNLPRLDPTEQNGSPAVLGGVIALLFAVPTC